MGDGRWFYRIRHRLRTLVRRNQMESELDEELRYHLDRRIEQEIARGQVPEEARRIAVRAMEGIEQKKEECRDMRRVNFIETLLQDIRYAFRVLGQSRGFSAVAVLTLALGIGASMAILTVVNSALLRPLPFPDASRLVVLFAATPARGVFQDTTSFPDFLDWKGQSHSFTSVAAWRRDPFNVSGGGAPEPIAGLRASHELFEVLGMNPAMGRVFDKEEQAGKSLVAVIGYGLWMRRFGGDPNVLGKSIVLNDEPHSIIGVLPQGFHLPDASRFVDSSFTGTDVVVPIPENASRSAGYLRAIARLKPEASIAAAQREMDGIARRLEQEFPLTNRGRGVNVVSLQRVAVGNVRTPLLVMMGAAIFVLLIGCANVGNLVLARGIARRREFALRSALGAGAARLVRQLLTESIVLALLGALLGSAAAFWGSKLLAVSLSQQFVLPAVTFDWRLLGLAVLTGLLSGVLCGLPPALMVRKAHLSEALKEGGRGQAGGRSENRLRNLLVISETALTVMLLTGAGLLLKSFVLLERTDPGVNPRNVLMADLVLSKRYTDPQRREVFLREMVESVRSLPGVRQAAVHIDAPFQGGGARQTFRVEGHPDPALRQGHAAAFNVISPGFFGAMGMPIKLGRGFDERDTRESAPALIVNETMARRFWPEGDAIGKRIRFYYERDSLSWFSIVGVAGDVRYRGRDSEPVPQVFVPYQQYHYRQPYVSLVLRTAADPASLVAEVKARIWAVDPDQPVLRIQTMEHALSQSVANRRVYLLLLSAFAATALLMATAGIYGLVSYAVARRTQEMGIRVALGATAAQILAIVIRQGMLLASIGVAIGIAGSLVLTKAISGLLYGITPTDTPTFAATALVFLAVAFAATYIPARRAAMIDPAVAFRFE
jgi:predicted permease